MSKESYSQVRLINVADIHEANIMAGLLQSQGIPVDIRSQEAGEYLQIYHGMSFYGFDLWIPESALEKAEQLINASENVEDYFEDIDKEEENTVADTYEKRAKLYLGSLRFYWFLLLILGILGVLMTYLFTGRGF